MRTASVGTQTCQGAPSTFETKSSLTGRMIAVVRRPRPGFAFRNRALGALQLPPPMPPFPEWWKWDLSFTGHAEMRMEQRGVTEVDLRAMLERATGFRPNVVEGRFMIDVRHQARPWLVIVEPDAEAKLLVVVTVYEVSA
jgi:hypothetical protein